MYIKGSKTYIKFPNDLIKEAEEITGTDYEADEFFIEKDSLEFMVEELIHSYNAVVEKFEEYVKKVDEEYIQKEIDPYLEYGVSEKDF